MENNFQKIIFQEIINFFKPVIDTRGDPREIIKIFEECGWDMGSVLGSNEDDFVNAIKEIISISGQVEGYIDNPPDSFLELITALSLVAPPLFVVITNSTSVINNLNQTPRINELPEDAVNFLIARYLYLKSPFLYRLLELAGIISVKSGAPIFLNGTLNGVIIHSPYRTIHFYFEALGELLSNPATYFKNIYWPNGIPDQAEANKVAQNLFPRIANLLATLKISAFIGRGIGPDVLPPAEEERLKGMMTLRFPYYIAETNTEGSINISLGLLPETEQGPGVYVVPSVNIELVFPFGSWRLHYKASAQIEGFSIGRNGFNIYKGQGNLNEFTTDISIEKVSVGGNKALLVGSATSTRFEIGKIEFGGGVSISSANKEFRVLADLHDCALVIAGEEGDTFLNTILGEGGVKIAFNLKVIWSSLSGFHIEGSGALEINLPTHIVLGPIEIESATIALRPTGSELPLELSATIKGTLGPVLVVVKNIGVRLITTFPSTGGNIGPLDLQAGFKFPSAIGLSIDTPVVKAGGFLSIEPDEYIGALELEIKAISLAIKAIAIINTKLPGNQPGFSLLVIITAEFSPITLVFGFTLNGLGGLFGYKRAFESGELRLGLKTKALDSILFPKNVIANITKITGDLKRVFPMGNNFLIGPMVKIGWGASLVTAEIGILIQVPDPIVIAILGVIRLQLPEPKDAIVKLQINFLGIIDFEKKLFSLDASLTDSRILTFTLTGDFALRIGWGSPVIFIFSSGGFHPDFKEAPVELQHMERLGLQIINEEEVKIGIGTYLALTTNTVQIGAYVRLWVKAGPYTALAEVGFDALIQFNPFFFTVAIFLTGRVTGPMIDIVIEVKGNLSGPKPWHVWGHAHAKVVFFEISMPFDKTFGEPIEELAVASENVLKLLQDEVIINSNWKATTVINGASKVSLREITPGPGSIILHPNSVLSFNQRVVPLEVKIHNFGNKGIEGIDQFFITGISILVNNVPQTGAIIGSTLYDSFAPGNFFEIAKDQKLSRPSFEKMKSGKEFTFGSSAAVAPAPVSKNIDYEIMYIRKKKTAKEGIISFLNPADVVLLASGGAAAKSKFSVENNRVSYQAPPAISVNRPGYIIVKKADHSEVLAEEFGNQAEAYNRQAELGENETLILSTQEKWI